MTAFAAGPDSGTPTGSPPPTPAEVDQEAQVAVLVRLAVPVPREAAMFRRPACPAAGRAGRSCRRPGPGGSGRARRRVPAGIHVRGPGTARNSSTTSRPRSVCRPSAFTSGSARTPTHQISVRVGTYSPLESCTLSSSASATDGPVRMSTPRRPAPGPRSSTAAHPAREAAAARCQSAASDGLSGQPGSVRASRVASSALRRDLGAGVAGADDDERERAARSA